MDLCHIVKILFLYIHMKLSEDKLNERSKSKECGELQSPGAVIDSHGHCL